MKGFLKALSISLFCLPFFFTPLFGQEETIAGEQITLFKSDIVLEQNTDINVREEIHYSFSIPRRGIIREIPTNYKVQIGLRRPTRLILNELYYYPKDQPNQRFTQYERSSESGYAIFKIGNPDVTIQGEYVYVIDYTLRDAVNYYDTHDEFFLNITGNEWYVTIQDANANIKLPGEITEKVCFTGATDSTESNCTFEEVTDNEVNVTVNSPLATFEGYTVAIKMPKGTLQDTRSRQRVAFLISNIGLLLPIPIFFFLLGIVKKKGQNKKLTVIPHYEPEKDMYPLLAGYVYTKRLDNKHITAEIIQLAIDGYIKIRQEGKRDYVLIKDNSKGDHNKEIVQTLYSGLFGNKEEINTKKIPSNFFVTVRLLFTKIDKEVYDQNYFDNNRKKLRGKFSFLGSLGLFLSFFSFGPLSELAATGWSIGFMISSIIALILSSKIDLKGEKANKMYYELEGLKMYINTAEKHRIEFHNDPEKFRGVFEKLLPYAIIFGLEKKWAEEFKDIYKEPPSWYQGDISTFNSYVLASSIAGINRNVQSKARPPGSSGGFSSSHGSSGGSGFSGGSSGGGFGGGGGSSW